MKPNLVSYTEEIAVAININQNWGLQTIGGVPICNILNTNLLM
jgi:hypothetical protein